MAAWTTAWHDGLLRLDEEKLEALRSWGERLGRAEGAESAAVGRAILMLVEEIDRLHVALWHARMQPGGADNSEAAKAEDAPAVESRLHSRLQRVLRRTEGVEPAEQSGSDAEGETATSPQAWLAELRRQK